MWRGQAGSDRANCSLPQIERTGGWICSTGIRAPAPNAKSATTTEHCDVHDNCWYRVKSYLVEWYSAQFFFGYGGTNLGSGNAYITWRIRGAEMRQNPVQFAVSTYTVSSDFNGELDDGRAGAPYGGNTLGSCIPISIGAAAADVTRRWPKVGCGVYNATTPYHNMVAEMSWHLSQYEGYWYIYGRSVVAYAADHHDFHFQAVNKLPGNAVGDGYTP